MRRVMSFKERYEAWKRPMRCPSQQEMAEIALFSPCLVCQHEPLVVKRPAERCEEFEHEHIVVCGCTSGSSAQSERLALRNWQSAMQSTIH